MKASTVVAAIIKKNDLYFIVQRNKKKHLGLKWEFPGGKVELKETLEMALIREIKEELNILINVNEKIAEQEYEDDKIKIILHYFLCTHQKGKIKLKEHENFAWVSKNEFSKFDFAEGDSKILLKI